MTKCACGNDASVFENGKAECVNCYLKRVRNHEGF